MSYSAAQTLLIEMMGGVMDATALETYLGTPGNRGLLDFLMSDENLGPQLFGDESAFTAVRDSSTARAQLIANDSAMQNLANSLLGMMMAGANAAFMNAVVLKGRAIYRFIKSPWIRQSCQSGSGYTNLAAAQVLAGSKLKKTLYASSVTVWTRPSVPLLWMYILCGGSGAPSNASVTGGHGAGGGAGQIVGKSFEGVDLPAGDLFTLSGSTVSAGQDAHSCFVVGDGTNGSSISGGTFASGNTDLAIRSNNVRDQALLLAPGGEGVNQSTLSSLISEEQLNNWGTSYGSLFSRMANSPMQDLDVLLRNPKVRKNAVGNFVTVGSAGMNSPIGPFSSTKATLGGTGAFANTPATGYCAGGFFDGAVRNPSFGFVGIWWIED